MNIDLIPFAASWIALAGTVLILAVYRHWVAGHEDDTLHVSDAEAGRVAGQAATAHRLEVVDRWGKVLTIAGAVYGVVLVAAYFYQYWVQSSHQMWK